MLYMPMMDLQQHLKQELLANPFLELLEPEEEETPRAEGRRSRRRRRRQKEDEIDWEEILLNGFEVGGTREQYEEQEYTEPVTVETTDLIDHLREQLQMLDLTPRQLLLAEEFLGNINEDGYLAASLEEILGSVNQLVAGHASGADGEDGERRGRGRRRTGPRRAATVRRPRRRPHRRTTRWPRSRRCSRIIQRLDPPGVGARDLRECLLLQLERAQAETDSLTYRLVTEAFPDLIAHRWNDLAKRFGVEPAAVQAAADELARLDPKPGLKHSSQGDGYIIPDLIVDKIDGRYQVFLNDTGMPRLRLSAAPTRRSRATRRSSPRRTASSSPPR